MQKKFLVNLAISLFLNLLVKPFWIFGIDRTVQNTVGLADYGFYLNIFNFAFLFNILLDAGITNFNNRNIAQHVQLLNKHFSSLVVLKFMLTFVYIAVTFSIALVLGYRGDQLIMLAWVGFNQFLLSFILYFRSNISGLLMFMTDSVISVLDRVLMILICAVLLWGNVSGGVFRIEWFVYAQTAAYLATLVIAAVIVMRKAKFRKLSWSRPFFLVILKKSLPFAVLVLLMSVYNRVDTVFIERLVGGDEGERQVGIYAHAFRLLDALNQFAWLFAVLLLPIYSRMIKLKEDVGRMTRLPYALLITSAIIVAMGSLFYRYEIMEWLYPKDSMQTAAEYAGQHRQSATVFGILMFGFLGSTTMYVYSTLLTANGNLRQLNLVALAGIGVNFLVNILLVPRMQATGAAVASLATQLFTAGAYMALAHRIFRFKPDIAFLSRIVIFTLVVIFLNFLCRQLRVDWKISFMVMMIASALSAFVLKLVNLPEMWRMVKERATP
ncbi:MAG: oligosaccharide flippase family protein [Bacteroidales bacterium]|nr:oligosaccharide flippase family protein [Bacteroidales bacterium]